MDGNNKVGKPYREWADDIDRKATQRVG